jgi:hypothetical protein
MSDALNRLFPDPAVKAASTVPAYALVFINLIIVLVVSTQAPTGAAIAVDICVLLLSAYVIWIVELRSRRSVVTKSHGAAVRLSDVRDLDEPVRAVLGPLVDNDNDVYVVYSSTEVTEFIDQLGSTIHPKKDPTYGIGQEVWVTTIPDAIGAGRLHNLLYLGGKRERQFSITSWPGDFQERYWESSMILIGSGKSNRITTEALEAYDSTYRFSPGFDSIINVRSPDECWPKASDELSTTDYGILVKMKVEQAGRTNVYIVAAGVGPYGTRAACEFLSNSVHRIHSDYGSEPFAYLLAIARGKPRFEPTVVRETSLPVQRR